MRISRTVAVAVLGAALAIVPNAVAARHNSGRPSKPHCVHNGVASNPAGHANCGLHRGQNNGDQTTGAGDDAGTGDSTGGAPIGE